ncbi:MAG: hypothetical protein H6634_07365 [Anaerolineales bacterium]|nr:hypothetical protein [Anaerolineales bacterium]MCB9111052.1 hypothetical protein [Anaerolineales bacterium]
MKWIIAFLVIATAGYMLFDGTRALVVGNYITSTEGDYAGQLGPWAGLVRSVGVDPNSAFMKIIFVAYGLSALAALSGFMTSQPWGRGALFLAAVLGLWYLPVGSITNIIVLVLLLFQRG